MAFLLAVRITPDHLFSFSGIDYAGPIVVCFFEGQGSSFTKGYIAIFICMFLRAVHIENVSDLTIIAFSAAFARFCSCRGDIRMSYSYNGSAFKGASTWLDLMFKRAFDF